MDTMKDGSSIPATEAKPVRFDLSNTILKQLSKPLHSLSLDIKSSSDSNSVDCISLDVSKQNEVSHFVRGGSKTPFVGGDFLKFHFRAEHTS